MQIEDSRPRWGILLGLFVVLGGLAALPFFLYRQPKDLPTYQVQNFIGKVEVYSNENKAWVPVQRGDSLTVRDKIRTGSKGEADLRVPDQIAIRVKENSEIEVQAPRFFERSLRYRLHLLRGIILGSTEEKFEGEQLDISTPTLVAAVRGTMFQVEVQPESGDSSVRVLKGSVKVRSRKGGKAVMVRSLEKTEVKKNAVPLPPVRVTRQEWDRMKETYELIGRSTAVEARQLDLSKQAGSLFDYVFDHGTFYTPEFGHAEREFTKEEASGNKVYLKIDYDVFPTGSFVGVYIKTRNLDLAKFKGFEFQARVNPEEGAPESMRIEFKTQTGLARVFVPRDFKPTWQDYKYPLIVRAATPITEIALVFSNEKVGNAKKGAFYLRDFNLIPVTANPPRDTTT